MKRVVLVDPYVSGHHLSYIRIYAVAFLEIGCEVAVMTTETALLRSRLCDLAVTYGDRIRVCELYRRSISKFESANALKHGRLNNLFKSFFSWLDFRDIARSIMRSRLKPTSLVFILWLDSYITRYLPACAVDAVMPTRFAGLYFHPAHLKMDAATGKFYRDLLFYLPLFRSRKLKFVAGFDERLINRLAECYRGVEFVTFPDIAEKHQPDLDNEMVREILARARKRKIVSLLGSLDRRKNVWEFFETARQCRDDDLFFVCVGKLHSERFSAEQLAAMREIEAKSPDRLYFHDGFIPSDRAFDALFYISDAVFAVYRDFPASSNMVVKSALFEKPIIVSDEHLMGELVREFQLGVTVGDERPQTLLGAIRQVVSQTAHGECDFERFNKTFSFENLKSALGRLL